MKVTCAKEGFIPFSINVHFDTHEEAEAFHNIFNCSQVLESAGLDGEGTRRAIEEGMKNVKNYDSDTWSDFFKSLKKNMNSRI